MSAPVFHGAVAGKAPWTPEEDDAIRAHLAARRARSRKRVTFDWPGMLAALPGRSRSGVVQRAHKLGLSTPRWSPEEDAILTRCWQEDARRTILAKLPLRSWAGIVHRAQELGFGTIPQGWTPLCREAQRLNYCYDTAREIVAWSRRWAPLVEALCAWGYACAAAWARLKGGAAPDGAADFDGGAVATRLHTTSCAKKSAPSRRWLLVEEGALEAAAVRWESWEGTAQAAARRGVTVELMRWWVHAAGYTHNRTGRQHLRLPRAWWDAVSAHVAPTTATRAEHARRLGASDSMLDRALREAGLCRPGTSRRARHITVAQADAALAAWLSRPRVQAMAAARAAPRSPSAAPSRSRRPSPRGLVA